MRLCRFSADREMQIGFYGEEQIVPLAAVSAAYAADRQEQFELPQSTDLLDFLPPRGAGHATTANLFTWFGENPSKIPGDSAVDPRAVTLHVPIPKPSKLFLLAGNYAAHIEEGGDVAAERAETFPYVFMKPPSTTLTDPGRPVVIPRISPDAIDWELELAVVIGGRGRHVPEADALKIVAGYTVINDISNRIFRPNPNRKKRERDRFFDWLHGKWFDSFCPCGPCLTAADAVPDPQALDMELRVNGQVQQSASTAQQIFSVAEVIAFVSSIVTLEPGDIISTGTAAGVGHAKSMYLKPGDTITARIEGIGTLTSPVVAE